MHGMSFNLCMDSVHGMSFNLCMVLCHQCEILHLRLRIVGATHTNTHEHHNLQNLGSGSDCTGSADALNQIGKWSSLLLMRCAWEVCMDVTCGVLLWCAWEVCMDVTLWCVIIMWCAWEVCMDVCHVVCMGCETWCAYMCA